MPGKSMKFVLSGKWYLMLSLMIILRVKIWPTHEMQLVLALLQL